MSRLISAQKETVFRNSDYDKIQKVYSIWILPSVMPEKCGTINKYRIQEEHMVGGYEENKEKYDKMTIVLLGLEDDMIFDSGNFEHMELGEGEKLLKMLRLLLSNQTGAEIKKHVLETEFKMTLTREFREEVENMTSLSADLIIRGRKEGIERGIKSIVETLQELGLSMEEIAERVSEKFDMPYDETLSKVNKYWLN